MNSTKLIGIIILIVTTMITLVVALFYEPNVNNTNIELAQQLNIDSIFYNDKRLIPTTDDTTTAKDRDVFVTQAELDSISLSDLQRKKRVRIDQLTIDQTMNNLTNSTTKLSSALSNDSYNGIENDTLFKSISARIRNRDNPTTTAPSQESKIEKRRNMLSQSWSASKDNSINEDNLLPAVIHKTQTIKNNQTVSIRTKKEFSYRDILIPRNTLIIGVATFDNNRLNINIHNIRLNNQLIAAKIVIFGSDGIKGLEISTNEIKKSLDSDATDEIASEVTSTINKAGSQVGRIAGALIGQTIRKVNNEKQRQVTLIDNQSIYLSIQ